MVKNVCGADRVIRVILGIGLLSLLFILEGAWRFIGLLGLVALGTAAFGYCPLWAIFKVNTCRVKAK